MERVKLRTARLRIGWTLERAAEHIGVGRNTLWRWELGMSDPYPYNVYLICQTYGKSAAELDLKSPDGSEDTHLEYVGRTRRGKHDADSETPIEVFHDYMRRDLELHLQCLVFDWLHHRKST